MKISDLGEFGLIDQIAAKFKDIIPEGCIGIGDDCAVIPISLTHSMVVTTDMLVEDVHFLRNETTPFDLGYKSLAVNLSDIAAMGATAHSSFLSIALPASVSTEWCEGFLDGYRSHNIALLGGDTTKSSDKIAINISAMGLIDNRYIKLRSGAKSGDKIYVTGSLGDSAGGFQAILNSVPYQYPSLLKQHSTPRPHLAEGELLGRTYGVTSMMDISDGLASDLLHILKASGGVGAEIDLEKIPISNDLKHTPWDAMRLALTGGEDYCLLFTAAAETVFDEALTVYEIGRITCANPGEISWIENGAKKPLVYSGYSHF